MSKTSRVYASSYYTVEEPNLVHLEGGFTHHVGKTYASASGCLEGHAVAIGQLIAQLMNREFLTFEERVDYANIIMQVVDELDKTGEAHRAMRLASR